MRSLRSRQGSSAFSLFAFQDILITTIGVVLLIMLLLVLQISEKTDFPETAEVSQNTTGVPSTHYLNSLIQVVSLVETSSSSEVVPIIKGIIKKEQSQTKTITQNTIDQTRKREGNPPLEEVAQLQQKISVVTDRIRSLEKTISEEFKSLSSVDHLSGVRMTRERLEEQQRALLANDNLVYIQQDDPRHTPFLVEIKRNSVCIHGYGVNPGLVNIRIANSSEEALANATVSVIMQLVSNRNYPLLLVAPGGGSVSHGIRLELMEKEISCGTDLLVDNQTSVPNSVLPMGETP
jgi:hypothetical protein